MSPIVGLGAFLLWIGSLEPIHQQGQLRGEWLDPFRGLAPAIGDMFGSQRLLDGLHTPFAIALVILVVLCIRWLPPSYTLYTTRAVLSVLSATNLNSLERYGLNAFPLALATAVIVRRYRLEVVATAVAAGVITAVATLAFIGSYVP